MMSWFNPSEEYRAAEASIFLANKSDQSSNFEELPFESDSKQSKVESAVDGEILTPGQVDAQESDSAHLVSTDIEAVEEGASEEADRPTEVKEDFAAQSPAENEEAAPVKTESSQEDLNQLSQLVEQLRAEIYEQAFEAGREAGRSELPWKDAQALQSATESLVEVANGLQSLRRSYLHAHRRALISIACQIAEKIVGRTLQLDPELLIPRIESALSHVGEGDPITLQLSPRDIQTLETGGLQLLAELGEDRGVVVNTDPKLSQGDIRVIAGKTLVDGRVHELIERIAGELEQLVTQEEESS